MNHAPGLFHVEPSSTDCSSPAVHSVETSTKQRNCAHQTKRSTWNEWRGGSIGFHRLNSCDDLTDPQARLFHVERPCEHSSSSTEKIITAREIRRAGAALQSAIGPISRFE
jgi:hypothetical protein